MQTDAIELQTNAIELQTDTIELQTDAIELQTDAIELQSYLAISSREFFPKTPLTPQFHSVFTFSPSPA
ncbi:hypothetical protein [Nostoc sp. DSM 114167]|uniref:hypothetical protein n=1 Tax=Nostoc sp. DSM 114167 TaxID=3439050 RepID=UPI00404684D5